MVELRNIEINIVEGLQKELDCYVIRANQTAPAPAYPYISYTITTPMLKNGGTYGMIVENDTDKSDADGRPANSFECFVLGGNDTDIAKAIYAKKPIGVKCVGDITVNITDKGGFEHPIKFSRTVEKQIYIKIQISVNSLFEKTGTEDIKANIIDYISTFSNGEDVILSALYSKIHSVVGIAETNLLLLSSDNINYSSSNIKCASNEVAKVDLDNIKIEVSNYVDN